jgi:serine/threonine protein kinase
MNAESSHMKQQLAIELASFDNQLDGNAGNAKLVASIQSAIGRLLESAGGNDAGIRRVLEDQYAAGALRKETFQLVESILDSYMTEQIPTEPTAATEARARDNSARELQQNRMSVEPPGIPPLNPPGNPAGMPNSAENDVYDSTDALDEKNAPDVPSIDEDQLPPVTAGELWASTQVIEETEPPGGIPVAAVDQQADAADGVWASTMLIDDVPAPSEKAVSPQTLPPVTADDLRASTELVDEVDSPISTPSGPGTLPPVTADDVKSSTQNPDQAWSVGESPARFESRLDELPPMSADDVYSSTTVIDKSELPPEAPAERAQVGSVLRDRFLLQKHITGGSMGVVYKALDRRLAEVGETEPWVAIKVLSPALARNGNALRALQQEAAKGRNLTHPNIVRFIDFDRDEDLYYLVMEWLDGKSLAEILDTPESKTLEIEAALKIVRQVGKALEYAHRCGIVHADVKPGNIMIMPDGTAKLFDFGVARVWQKAESGDAGFDPGILGAMTPAYSSMQVITGERPVPADDVFSLACLFYRLVAGYRVFGPRDAAEACEAGMEPQPLPGLSRQQWLAVRKALSFSRVTRYESVAAFLEALETAPAPEFHVDPGSNLYPSEPPDFGKWLIGFVVLALIGGFAAYELGYLNRWVSGPGLLDSVFEAFESPAGESRESSGSPDGEARTAPGDEGIEMLPAEPAAVAPRKFDGSVEQQATDVADAPQETSSGQTTESVGTGADTPAPAPSSAAVSASAAAETAAETAVVKEPETPADVEIPLNRAGFDRAITVTLREDAGPVTVDLLRLGSLDSSLRVRMEEVDYSGNRSPLRTGQYTVSGGRTVEFRRGSERARVELAMAPDPLREADQQSTLKVRAIDGDASALAYIRIELEDDDQRAFATNLAPDTVGFAVSQMSVGEKDPAAQIDIVRYNPGDESLLVNYTVSAITATEGEDYFAPGVYSIVFAPGQRSARLLIPLVQDTRYEGDEAFVVEIIGSPSSVPDQVYQRIAVMIRDDDTAPPGQPGGDSP